MMKLAGTDKYTVSSLQQLATACAARKGYKAEGRRWNLPRLLREVDISNVPVVAHFEAPTKHYVLVIGRVGEFFLLSDPDRGDITVHQTDFLRRWSGRVLIVKSLRSVNDTPATARKSSAKRRLRTLERANALISPTHF